MLHVDTLIIGGAVMGSSIAYWLSENQDYDGTIVVVEPDPTYAHSSTALSEAYKAFNVRNRVFFKFS